LLLSENQLAVVTAEALNRIATIHSSPALPELSKLFLGRVGTKNDIGRLDTKGGEEPEPKLMGTPDI